MGKTMVEKILGAHAQREVSVGENVDVVIDARLARDFGGANVVKNIRDNGLGIDDPSKTFFTLDCNPGGSDQKYAAKSKIVNKIKGISSFVLRQEFPILVKKTPKALWMPKVMRVSVGNEMDKVRGYIRNQGSHHGYKG